MEEPASLFRSSRPTIRPCGGRSRLGRAKTTNAPSSIEQEASAIRSTHKERAGTAHSVVRGTAEMTDKELAELQNPENWAFEAAERRPARRGVRAIVSVAFTREDFERVAAAAEQLGKRTSEFIREAALGRVNRQMGSATLSSSSGPGWVVVT